MLWRVAAVIATGVLAAAAGTGPSTVSASPTSACGVELWPLKTFSDPQRKLVKLRPRNTTIAAIDALPMPSSADDTLDRL
jgi:hypothetical protein